MTDQETSHKIIARLFDLPVRDMGGGLRIVSLEKSWMPVEERDLIVKAVTAYSSSQTIAEETKR